MGGFKDDDRYGSEEEEEDLFLPPKPTKASTKTSSNRPSMPSYTTTTTNSNNNNNNHEDVPGRCSVSTVSSTNDDSLRSNPNNSTGNALDVNMDVPSFHDSALDDLVFDERRGSYVYKDDLLRQDQLSASNNSHYSHNNSNSYKNSSYESHPPAQQQPPPAAQSNKPHYTLEEMCVSAQLDDGEFDDDAHEMEISPGHYVPFRGAKETWHAVTTRHTTELECLDCMACLVCINDCEFTVCPDCRVVNPVFCDNPVGPPFGVGMGFKKEWVLKKQMLQMEKERRKSDQHSLHNQAQKFLHHRS